VFHSLLNRSGEGGEGKELRERRGTAQPLLPGLDELIQRQSHPRGHPNPPRQGLDKTVKDALPAWSGDTSAEFTAL